MKKLTNIILALAAVALNCGCINEEEFQKEDRSGIRVYSDLARTRTEHHSENGVTSISWVEGDRIGLSTSAQGNLGYIADNSGPTSEFTAADAAVQAAEGDVVYAYYPYDEWSWAGTETSFHLPHTQGQTYSTGLSYYDALYAKGTVADNELALHFKHVFAFLKITVPVNKLERDPDSGCYVIRIISDQLISNIEGYYNIETSEFEADCTTDVMYWIDQDLEGQETVTITAAIMPQTYGTNIGIYAWFNNRAEELLRTITVPESGLQAGKIYTIKVADTPTFAVDYIDEYGINHGPGVEIDGIVWAPVNCGYHATDYKYGKLYQWGRKYGQGYDATVPTVILGPVDLVTGQSKNNENIFYKASSSPWDWLSPQNDELWNSGTEENPVKSEYDPCPAGWRVPSYAELSELCQNYSSWTSEEGQLGYWFSGASSYTENVPQVFFPAAGSRRDDGGDNARGDRGFYWSSSSHYIYAYCLYFRSSDARMNDFDRATGYSVRCVQE